MTTNSTTLASLRANARLPLRFILGVLITLAAALAVFYWLMRPSMIDLQAMMLFLAITAGISLAAGYAAYRLGWLSRVPSLRWALIGTYVLAAALTFLNVWMTARLMFASAHDLQLALVLLLFASGIAVSLGYFLASAVTGDIASLGQGARAIAAGRYDARVEINGSNELAELARTFNDMAAQLEAADHKQRQLDQMRRNLVAWAGHDLRTPLASIQAIVEALADGVVDDPDTVQRYLHTAQRDIRALSHLIDDLFDLAQFDAGGLTIDRQPADLGDLVSDVLGRFGELAARRSITVEGRVPPGLAPIALDSPKIERVLTNLIDNALRHTPEGGNVTVAVTSTPTAARVTVQDTGEGIASGDAPFVFDQFYRGEKSRSRETGGAGLGLAIARRIVAAHGGEIGVDSEPGAGACFWFTLPR